MKMRLFFSILVCLLGLQACTSTTSNYIGKDASTIIFSMKVLNNAPQGAYEIYIKNKETSEKLKYQYVTGYAFASDEPDFKDNLGNGVVFANKIKKGDYEIYRITQRARNAKFLVSFTWDEPIPFSVEKTGHYLGSFVFEGIAEGFLTGADEAHANANLNGAVNIKINIKDERERDLKIAFKKYNFLNENTPESETQVAVK